MTTPFVLALAWSAWLGAATGGCDVQSLVQLPPYENEAAAIQSNVKEHRRFLNASGSEQDLPQLKLIINSNPLYETPRKVLLDSLRAAQFENWTSVVVVVGGADKERIYQADEGEFKGITYIETKFMSYDLTGMSMLNRYKDNALVRANAYLYLDDSCSVGMAFRWKFQALASVGFYEMRASPRPFSFVCAFGHGLVERYGTNFDSAVSKNEVTAIEFGRSKEGVKLLDSFADKVTTMAHRKDTGAKIDIYNTGYPRIQTWYPDLDVYKYIFFGHWGLRWQHPTHSC